MENIKIDLTQNIDKETLVIICRLESLFKKHNHDIYLVGGCVRDLILNEVPNDYDITTDALPDRVIKICNQYNYEYSNQGLQLKHILEVGKNFGVIVIVFDNGLEIEVATFRNESNYTDGRRPDGVEFCDMETDYKRRDFTINALYYNISKQLIYDIDCNTYNDIKNLNNPYNKTHSTYIRTVGKAEDRFDEDKLRVLRYIRFKSRFNCQDNIEIEELIKTKYPTLVMQYVSEERIREEFIKGLKRNFKIYLDNIVKLNMLYPCLNINKLYTPIESISDDETNHLNIISLLMFNEYQLTEKLYSLKYSKDEIDYVVILSILLKEHNNSFDLSLQHILKMKRYSIQKFGKDFEFEIKTGISNSFFKLLKAFNIFRFTVESKELLDKGIKGVDLGKEIERLEINNFIEHYKTI